MRHLLNIIPLLAFASGTIIQIPDDYLQIQQGIVNSNDGDTVLVQPGTYVENINFNGHNITLGSMFIMTGDTNYLSQTVIDGDQSGTVVTFNSGEDSTTVLSGFTIMNGSADYGGGIYCDNNSSPKLTQVVISDNSVIWALPGEGGGGGGKGGGIYCNNSSPILKNIYIHNNSATVHDGLDYGPSFGGGISCHNSSITMTDITITNNFSAGYGGGLSLFDSNPNLRNVTISNNSAYTDGGGISIWENSNPVLSNVTIYGNSAGDDGGGISCHGSNISFDEENRCSIYSNNVLNQCYGADIYTDLHVDVIVDTFTVLVPTDNFAYPIENFSFDILNAVQEQVCADLFVSPEGDNENDGLTAESPLQTIQHALSIITADSMNQNTIILSNGMYSFASNGEYFPINIPDYVSMEGESESGVILNAENSGNATSVIRFNQVNNSVVSNLTIRGFSTDATVINFLGSSPLLTGVTLDNNSGIAINCSNSSSPTMIDLTIRQNFGSGIVCSENSNPLVTNVMISENSGTGFSCVDSSPILTNVTISDNNATGFYCHNSSPVFTHVEISNNSSNHGGGIDLWGSSPIFTDVIIKDNSANCGGGIYCSYSSPIWSDVRISGNSANDGGGIYFDNSSPTLTNVVISENSAEIGGGVYCTESNPILTNVTMRANRANSDGAGIFCDGSNLNMSNSILWNENQEEIYFLDAELQSSLIISFSDLRGGVGVIENNHNGEIFWLDGNIDADPLFDNYGENPDALTENSPCIDGGDPDSPLDPDGSNADMGAFYFHRVLEDDPVHFNDILNGHLEDYLAFNDTTGLGEIHTFTIEDPGSSELGDELGLMDMNGLINLGNCEEEYGEILVGAGVWQGVPLEITTYGSMDFCNEPENDYGQYPGWIEGNPVVLILWRAAENQEYIGLYDDELGELTWSPVDQIIPQLFIQESSSFDVNGDNNIDVLDIVIIVDVIFDLIDISQEQFFAADANSDGSLDIKDIVMMIEYILSS